MEEPFDHVEESEGRRLPLVARLPIGLAGLFVFACGLGWLGFLVWAAFIYEEGPANGWLILALAVLSVPCFSFGRQWILEGLGRDPGAIGRRWRRISAGVVMALYGVGFAAAPMSIHFPELSTIGEFVVVTGPVSLGVAMLTGGVLLAIRTEPPLFILGQLAVLIVLTVCGSAAAVVVCLEAGVAIPEVVRLCLFISAGLLLGLARMTWSAKRP